ncbi:MAG: DUF1707 and DUF2154 domain-containing protein [Gemmatimonadetes bacterium]|nr:DUF1707 and DUF2154 domain-containing protein [Gemmatimonadota bacterium]
MTHTGFTPDRPLPAPLDAAARGGVTEAHREAVAQMLSVHYAQDRLSLDALDERMEQVYAAGTIEELRALIADLPAFPVTGADGARPLVVGREELVPRRGVAMAFMGGFERKGSWVIPRVFKAVAVMGGGVIDLREARFAAGVTELDILCFMGGCEVLVPPGVRVEVLGTALMGGFGSSAGDAANEDPNQPLLRVSGLAVMGGVDVKVRGVSRKAQRKYERAMLRAGEKKR